MLIKMPSIEIVLSRKQMQAQILQKKLTPLRASLWQQIPLHILSFFLKLYRCLAGLGTALATKTTAAEVVGA